MTSRRDVVLTGHVPPGREKFYENVPFEMPPGVIRIHVQYAYNDQIGSDPALTGGNTVDIGLFDWRGADFLDAGFRGWSGSARSEFYVGVRDATPGYLPGPMTPGTWFLALGFYKIGVNGCDYEARVRFEFGDETVDKFPPMLTLDSSDGAHPRSASGWYKGELHCHTVHSDGDSTASDVVAAAEALGLDFLAIMDHNNITHLVELQTLRPQKLILIPGYEVTTYKGHWNLWGPSQWIDFRVQSPDDMARAIRAAARDGALTSCNHPRPYGPPWEYEQVAGYACIEVWNGPWWLSNAEALAFWEDRLRRGQRLTAVGGSDMHRLKTEHQARLATPTTWIYCDEPPTAKRLLAALRAGHVFISEGPTGPQLYLRCGNAMMGDAVPRPSEDMLTIRVRVVGGSGQRLEFHGASGLLTALAVDEQDASYEVALPVKDTPYVRAQLVQPASSEFVVRALTNPLYIDS